MGPNHNGFCCWEATTTPPGIVMPFQLRGQRAVLASDSEGRVNPSYTKLGIIERLCFQSMPNSKGKYVKGMMRRH